MRKWETLRDLAALIIARAAAGKPVRLSPDTARVVGAKLMTADAKPTRDEVARLLCTHKCPEPCYYCRAKANGVVRVYGERVDPAAENPAHNENETR